MRVLMVATEMAPVVSVGDLGQSVGLLARALKKLGHDVRVVLPAYGCIGDRGQGHPQPLCVGVGFEKRLCKVWERIEDDIPVYLIEYNLFFARNEVYNSAWGACQDNDHRFVFFSRAAIELCDFLKWQPDIFHCHDWMTALLPVYLSTLDRTRAQAKAATLLTIHDLQFQGAFYSGLVEWAGLDRKEVFRSDNLESYEGVNLLKGGIYNATKISTVSPTHAQEIQTPRGGCGLEGVLKFRRDDLSGILEGVDGSRWDPASDDALPFRYSAQNPSGKARCKEELQKSSGLAEDAEAPLLGMTLPLSHQQGADLVSAMVPRLVTHTRAQLVLCGSGDESLQWGLSALASKYPGRVAVFIGNDAKRIHQIHAGADAMLFPCRFSPRGANVGAALRYGALPIARATGGLKDCVEPLGDGNGEGTGFLFEQPNPDALFAAVENACALYIGKPQRWQELMRRAMEKDLSWSRTADAYAALYAEAAAKRQPKI